MSSIGGYRSPVNLGLGRVPKNTDPEVFDELTEVYNSIHLLAAYMDRLRLSLAGGGAGQNPTETTPFTRFFVGPALVPIVEGNIVCPSPITGENGIILGALPHVYSSSGPECNFAGVALSSADVGQPVRVGIGPGALELVGAVSGSQVWTHSCVSSTGAKGGNGTLYASSPGTFTAPGGGTVYPMPIGISPADGFALIDQFIRRAY